MARQLTREERVTIHVLKDKGHSNAEIGRTLGVTEGSIRYHLRRQDQEDGRAHKARRTDGLEEAIQQWIVGQQCARAGEGLARPVNVQALHDWLRQEHGYEGSYKSILRFVRARYPKPRLRPYRRVETPAGAQAQVDWGEFDGLDIGAGKQRLYAFVMVLGHSRKEVLVWCRRMDQLSWHHAHNEAFRRLGGAPAVLRIDNLKTGMGQGAGPWGTINGAYGAYARAVGFHVDACLPRSPEHKGKVENKVGCVRRRLHLSWPSGSLAELQSRTDEQLSAWDVRRVCPATGQSVQASWEAERRLLRPVLLLPEPFDVAVTRPVHKDCTVSFEGRTYSVPFVLCGRVVEVHGCAGRVQVWHEGRVCAEHPRHTPERLVLDPMHYEGAGDERVAAPTPLGHMGRRLQEILEMPVEQRPLDLYAALAEVAR
jgi:transposase